MKKKSGKIKKVKPDEMIWLALQSMFLGGTSQNSKWMLEVWLPYLTNLIIKMLAKQGEIIERLNDQM